jgi:hypothetical protein
MPTQSFEDHAEKEEKSARIYGIILKVIARRTEKNNIKIQDCTSRLPCTSSAF